MPPADKKAALDEKNAPLQTIQPLTFKENDDFVLKYRT